MLCVVSREGEGRDRFAGRACAGSNPGASVLEGIDILSSKGRPGLLLDPNWRPRLTHVVEGGEVAADGDQSADETCKRNAAHNRNRSRISHEAPPETPNSCTG